MLEKVTLFITRNQKRELLILQHPFAGNQIPAGTVEAGEAAEAAAMREAGEETGLTTFTTCELLHIHDEKLSDAHPVIMASTKVYARPDLTSFDWAWLPRGVWVKRLRQMDGFSQISYDEWDRHPDPQYISMNILGWVADHALTTLRRRYFYHLTWAGETQDSWTVRTDGHEFRLFWSPLDNPPPIVSPHDQWLTHLTNSL